ncbi:carbohydrate ABC transporter permease [Cohnella phaseoli]|uniref:Carbohydrate ABC transporter membrane protein 1 (CUT1 family) n=1 Tax=Cohnella phaseoli TaxID=456490 RepID=A0A3D9I2K6_9BACL|nr:sugar ABC transporter permease [Cohnella phaseoli]RED55386.1 carbohydrate ABC transporter membrane protein 1 (CUT1 family) [Cohnella phaseoli]
MVNRRMYGAAAAFVLPAFILYTIAYVVPMFQTAYLSFFSWNGIKSVPLEFVGWNNYSSMFQMSEFYRSLKNIGVFILSSFLLILPIAFAFAILVTSKIKARRFFKVAFFMPSILPLSAVGLMWQFLLKGDGGLVNSVLSVLGMSSFTRDWLGEPAIAIYVVVVVNAWIYCGLNMIIFASGMVAIPEDLYEAAALDGATGWKKVRYITVPLMQETIKIFSILAITQSLRVFGQIFVMTNGGPNGATDVPTTLLYYESFKYNNFGVGNSIGTFIIVAALISTVVLNQLMNTRSAR